MHSSNISEHLFSNTELIFLDPRFGLELIRYVIPGLWLGGETFQND